VSSHATLVDDVALGIMNTVGDQQLQAITGLHQAAVGEGVAWCREVLGWVKQPRVRSAFYIAYNLADGQKADLNLVPILRQLCSLGIIAASDGGNSEKGVSSIYPLFSPDFLNW